MKSSLKAGVTQVGLVREQVENIFLQKEWCCGVLGFAVGRICLSASFIYKRRPEIFLKILQTK